jgi:hypothetical protein
MAVERLRESQVNVNVNELTNTSKCPACNISKFKINMGLSVGFSMR